MLARFWIILTLIGITNFCITRHAQAEDTDKPITAINTISIDGIEYDRKQVYQNFAEAVISGITYKDPSFSKSSGWLSKRYPWLSPHLRPENGVAQPLSVNKWTKPIMVSFGMPNDLQSFVDQKYDENGAQHATFRPINEDIRNRAVFPLAEKEAKDVVAALSDVLPVPISYLPMQDETLQNYGNIRIVLFSLEEYSTDKSGNKYRPVNIFKREFELDNENGLYNVSFGIGAPDLKKSFRPTEKSLKTAYIYTVNARRQVDGYFLPNANNEIDFAVCHIWEGHPENILKGLIRECLIRSLGFPDTFGMGPKMRDKHLSMLYIWGYTNSLPEQYKKYLNGEFYLTDMDATFIHLLYQENLKAGTPYTELSREINP